METQICCPKCLKQYNNVKVPRLLTMCGHTFCQNCIKSMIAKKKDGKYYVKCPQDNCTMDIQTNKPSFFPKNVSILKMAETYYHQNQTLSKIDLEDSGFFDKTILMQSPSQIKNNKINQNFLSNDNTMIRGRIVSLRQQLQQDVEICLLHRKPLDIICVDDLTRICSNCAIFGQHKSHHFKGLNQIQQQAKNVYDQFIQIFDKKKSIQKKILNVDFQEQIKNLLINKKKKMKKQLTQKYKKMIETVKQLEKQSINKVDILFKEAQQNLKEVFIINQKTIKQYTEWEIKSAMDMNVLKSNNIDDKISMLYGIKKQADMLLHTGNKLLNQMKQKQQKIGYEVENIIDGLGRQSQQYSSALVRDLIDGKFNTSYTSPFKKQKSQICVSDIYAFDNEESLLDDLQCKQSPRIDMYSSSILQKDLFNTSSNEFLLKQPKKIAVNKSCTALMNKSLQIKPSSVKVKNNKISLPALYQKTFDSILNDKIENVDFTNAQLSDNTLFEICSKLSLRVKTLKLAKNKLTDNGFKKIIPFLGGIGMLNLASNLLTQQSLNTILLQRSQLTNLKSITLSNNKILQKKNKEKIQKLKEMGILVLI